VLYIGHVEASSCCVVSVLFFFLTFGCGWHWIERLYPLIAFLFFIRIPTYILYSSLFVPNLYVYTMLIVDPCVCMTCTSIIN
jgi:hypothetical protein